MDDGRADLPESIFTVVFKLATHAALLSIYCKMECKFVLSLQIIGLAARTVREDVYVRWPD